MPFNILIVDDSTCMRKVLKKTITMCNIGEVTLFEAENGKEAIDVVKKEWIDLILTDINMPVMDGLSMVKQLHAEDIIKNLHVIVITSDRHEDTKKKINDCDVQNIIYKPFRPEELRQILISVLNLEDNKNDEHSNSEGLDF